MAKTKEKNGSQNSSVRVDVADDDRTELMQFPCHSPLICSLHREKISSMFYHMDVGLSIGRAKRKREENDAVCCFFLFLYH